MSQKEAKEGVWEYWFFNIKPNPMDAHSIEISGGYPPIVSYMQYAIDCLNFFSAIITLHVTFDNTTQPTIDWI